MLYQGKTLREIAGYDDYQLRYVLFRSRDQYGRLTSRNPEGFPPGVEVDADGMRVVSEPVPYAAMFQDVIRRRQGPERALARWQEFLQVNPSFGAWVR